MFKNVASQKVALFAFDTTSGAAKTGDGSNIKPYVTKDWGSATILGTTTVAELSTANAPGHYVLTLAQAETNADALLFSATSGTANISIVARLIYTLPINFTSMSITSSSGAVMVSSGTVTAVSSNIAGSVASVTGAVGSVTGAVGSVTGSVGSVTGNVGGNVVGSVTSVSSNVAGSVTSVTSNIAGTVASVVGNVGGNVVGSVTSVSSAVASVTALSAGAQTSIADSLLDRDMSSGADSGSTSVRTPRQALRFLRNKFAISSGTLTIYKEDDATPSWTGSVTASSSASLITANDPAGP